MVTGTVNSLTIENEPAAVLKFLSESQRYLGSAEARETSQNWIVRRFLGCDSVRPLRTGRRGGFSRSMTAAQRRSALMGARSIFPASGSSELTGFSE